MSKINKYTHLYENLPEVKYVLKIKMFRKVQIQIFFFQFKSLYHGNN